jgi:Tol biopolymer transport system component
MLTTNSGFRPRLGANCLFYVSASGTSESIFRLANGSATELWSAQGVQILGGPAPSPDGRSVAFSARQNGRSLLYVMGADGANPRIVTDALDLQDDPAWEPDGQALITAALDHGAPRLFRVPLNGGSPASFLAEDAFDPAWAPSGGFVLFSGPDIGTTFSVKAAKPDGSALALPALTLTRGARHLAFLPDGRTLVVLRGEIQHKNLWTIDLQTGTEQQLTDLPSDFDVRDFDVSPDGRSAVLERTQDRSEVVLVELPRK